MSRVGLGSSFLGGLTRVANVVANDARDEARVRVLLVVLASEGCLSSLTPSMPRPVVSFGSSATSDSPLSWFMAGIPEWTALNRKSIGRWS